MTTEAVVASPLYAAQQKIYARGVSGRFARLRIASVVLLLGVFFSTACLRASSLSSA